MDLYMEELEANMLGEIPTYLGQYRLIKKRS